MAAPMDEIVNNAAALRSTLFLPKRALVKAARLAPHNASQKKAAGGDFCLRIAQYKLTLYEDNRSVDYCRIEAEQ